MKMYEVDVKKKSFIIETKEVWAKDEDDAVQIALDLADKEIVYCDFNNNDFVKVYQMISVVEREENDSYWSREKAVKILHDKAMEVENGYIKTK